MTTRLVTKEVEVRSFGGAPKRRKAQQPPPPGTSISSTSTNTNPSGPSLVLDPSASIQQAIDGLQQEIEQRQQALLDAASQPEVQFIKKVAHILGRPTGEWIPKIDNKREAERMLRMYYDMPEYYLDDGKGAQADGIGYVARSKVLQHLIEAEARSGIATYRTAVPLLEKAGEVYTAAELAIMKIRENSTKWRRVRLTISSMITDPNTRNTFAKLVALVMQQNEALLPRGDMFLKTYDRISAALSSALMQFESARQVNGVVILDGFEPESDLATTTTSGAPSVMVPPPQQWTSLVQTLGQGRW